MRARPVAFCAALVLGFACGSVPAATITLDPGNYNQGFCWRL